MAVLTSPTVAAVVLIAQLGSPNYRHRETVTRQLIPMTEVAVPYLQAAQSHPNPEVAIRATFLLTTYYRKNAAKLTEMVRPRGWRHLPWMDMLPNDHPGRDSIVSQYLQRAQTKIGRHGSPHWKDYRFATHLYVQNMFTNGHSLESVQATLDRMAKAEHDWIAANGKRYNPPVPMPELVADAR